MDSNVAKARMAVERFEKSLSESNEFDEALANEYNRLRRGLAASFQVMSLAAVPRDAYRLRDLKTAVIGEMRRLYEGRVDSSFFVIRRYTTPHPDLYATLASRVGQNVPAWRLRLLSGDATHTERRTRELRDLGLQIAVVEGEDDVQYRLDSLEPDLTYGAAFQLRENASKSKKITPEGRDEIVQLAESTVELPERRGRA